MTSYKKHLNISLWVLFLLLFFIRCSKEEKKSENIVKINNSILTEEDLTNAIKKYGNSNRYKEEYINNWIRTEVLYSEAVNEGILDEKEFQSILEQSGKKLAVSLFLKKLMDENKINPNNDELLKYYEEQLEDFRLNDEAFRINICEFDNFDKAVQFRSILVESDWNKAINAFRGDEALKNNLYNQLKFGYLLQPQIIYNAVSTLLPNEVSIVLQTSRNNYSIVQLIERINKGDIPPFEAVKERLKEQLTILKQKEFIEGYIDKLVEDHNVEIKRYKE